MRLPKAGTIQVAPSILSADFARLADEIAVVEKAGVKMVHLDVMDGHFVPNITIGPPVIAKLRKCSRLVFDAHLMISEPAEYAERFVEAGANHITFHIEVADEPQRLIEKLHSLKCTAGICLNPETPVERIAGVAPFCDMVLVMTVRPGFGGQEFMPEAAKKISRVRWGRVFASRSMAESTPGQRRLWFLTAPIRLWRAMQYSEKRTVSPQ
jgi:ribulose-phosphate 3-epimerase